jgi:hypothetical protein
MTFCNVLVLPLLDFDAAKSVRRNSHLLNNRHLSAPIANAAVSADVLKTKAA